MTAGGASFAVSRLFAERPGRPEPITYWVVLGGEAIADASTYRLRSLDHAVRRSVPDGLLVRVSSIDPDVDRAFSLQAAFIDEMLLALPPADRRRVVGAQTERIRLPA
jgi:EpsI family protein